MRIRLMVRRLAALATAASFVLVLGVSHVVAAGIVVDTLDDTDADDGQCSLREAIDAANFDTASGAAEGECVAGSGADAITFAVSGTITLGADLPPVRDDVTIDGGGVITVDGADSYRPFAIIDGAVVELRELVITRGFSATAGGNIYMAQSPTAVSIVRTVVRDGAAQSAGGVWNNSGSLTVIDSTFSANTASNGSGGAIHNRLGGTLTMIGSTLAGNSACARGGGLWNTGVATVTNSTISGNAVGGCVAPSGGGVSSEGGSLDLVNVTVANNTGSGIVATTGSASIVNSVLAGNTPTDCGGVGLDGGNVASDASCSPSEATDLVSTDPLLGSLASNGGPTDTHALLPGSPAIGAAVGCPPPTVDQRGVARDDGACDAGAFEAAGVAASPSPEPSTAPSSAPSAEPSAAPSADPSAVPSADPSPSPSGDSGVGELTPPPTETRVEGPADGGSTALHRAVLLLTGLTFAALLLATGWPRARARARTRR